MKFKVERSKKLILEKPVFKECIITEISEPEKSQFGYYFEVKTDIESIPFNIKTRIYFDEGTQWKVPKFFDAFKVEPTERLENGNEDEVSYNFQDAVGKKALALVYQDEYTNVFDFIQLEAKETVKSNVMKRLSKYLNKRTAPVVSPMVSPEPTGEVPF